jgi:hypothetical protein
MNTFERYQEYVSMDLENKVRKDVSREVQSIVIQAMLDALRCDHLNEEYNSINIEEVEDIIEKLNED